jgi:hypothetical protein
MPGRYGRPPLPVKRHEGGDRPCCPELTGLLIDSLQEPSYGAAIPSVHTTYAVAALEASCVLHDPRVRGAAESGRKRSCTFRVARDPTTEGQWDNCC